MKHQGMNRSLFSAALLLAFASASTAQIVSIGGPLRHNEARPPLWAKLGPSSTTSSAAPYTPAQVRHAYGFDHVSGTGVGTTIAIVDAYGSRTLQSDFNLFCSTFGLPLQTIKQGKPAPNSGWAQETSLDVQWAHAIAPGAQILLVVAQTASLNNLLGAVDVAAKTKGVVAVSMSWGAGESSGEASNDSHFKVPGVTFVASAGDSGEQVEWPAASQYVVGVGGTSLFISDINGTYSSERAWSGSGGGISAYLPAPTYQNGWSGLGNRCVPDVSYLADPNTGVYVAYNGRWYQFGGTSVGAPQWAGLIALTGGLKNGATGAPYSVADLYSAAGTANNIDPTHFFDVIGGSNGPDPDDFAITGYDLVTGLGSPAAVGLVPILRGQ
jgi:subtilase family serine protease